MGKVKVTWTNQKNKTVDLTAKLSKATWSGANTEVCRTLTVTIASNPFDKKYEAPAIKTGDILKMYNGNALKFIGRVANIEKKGEIGTVDFTANDLMYNLIHSTTSKRFKNKTPEYITKAVCKDFGLETGQIKKTKTRIKKYIMKDTSPYNIIVAAYNKASRRTKKKYMPKMEGEKFEIIERGKVIKKLTIKGSETITGSQYQKDSGNIINKVDIYNEKGKKTGSVKRAKSIKRYGILQGRVDIDSGSGKAEAKAALQGPEQSASITAIGDWKCLAGYAVKIHDVAAGMAAVYWIKSDSHEFENGVHTMTLDLDFSNKAEKIEIAESKTTDAKTKKKTCNAVITAYYPGQGGHARDARGNALVAEKRTCAAPESVKLGSKVRIKNTGTEYDDMNFIVTDRLPQSKYKDKRYYIQILLADQAAVDSFGKKAGKVQITQQYTKESTISSGADRVAERAKSKVGVVKYIFGAADVPHGKADCSSFTLWCYQQVGVTLGRTAAAQAAAGQQVDFAKRQKGDLIIFKDTYISGPSHVGIVYDADHFIHCSSGAGQVTVSTWTEYYRQHFHSIRRIV